MVGTVVVFHTPAEIVIDEAGLEVLGDEIGVDGDDPRVPPPGFVPLPGDVVEGDPPGRVVETPNGTVDGMLPMSSPVVDDEVVVDESRESNASVSDTALAGPSETWLSAAETICQVRPVTKSVATSHAENMPNLRMSTESQVAAQVRISKTSRKPQGQPHRFHADTLQRWRKWF
jgi:hypothetical protein